MSCVEVFRKLRVTFDKEAGLVMSVEANRLAMMINVTPPLGQEIYRLKVTEMRGAWTFGVTKPSIKAMGVRGKLLGFAFLADGELGGFSNTSAVSIGPAVSGAVLGEDYPPLFMAFPRSQDLLQRLAPHGKFDVAVAARREEGDGEDGGPRADSLS